MTKLETSNQHANSGLQARAGETVLAEEHTASLPPQHLLTIAVSTQQHSPRIISGDQASQLQPMRVPCSSRNNPINLINVNARTQPVVSFQEAEVIMHEVFDFYTENQMWGVDREAKQVSAIPLMSEALASNKRLFLHKLRNYLRMPATAPDIGTYNPALANVPVAGQGISMITNAFGWSEPVLVEQLYQLQAVYTHSKTDRAEGHYKPKQHDMLSNFGWLYAGLKNQQRDKAGNNKAINLILNDEQTNIPANARVNADMLFRGGQSERGLSALGYELSFLCAAGFEVDSLKSDPATGLAKIKLTPPKFAIPAFGDLMLSSAQSFCFGGDRDIRSRGIDTQLFKDRVDHDPLGWGSILQVDWGAHGIA